MQTQELPHLQLPIKAASLANTLEDLLLNSPKTANSESSTSENGLRLLSSLSHQAFKFKFVRVVLRRYEKFADSLCRLVSK